jgi:ABC-type glycerol-3-phosphate transport system substrate-binding protein
MDHNELLLVLLRIARIPPEVGMPTANTVKQPLWLAVAVGSLLLGCGPAASPRGTGTNKPGDVKTSLRVLVIDDADLATSIKQQWQVRAVEEEIEVRAADSKELTTAKRLAADVVVFPARWMGELAERELIQPIPENMLPSGTDAEEGTTRIPVNDLLPTVRQCDLSWGRKLYAVTLGSPQLVLLYRPDVFAKLELTPPTTWEEYQSAATKLTDRAALGDLAPPEDRSWHAALEPTADGWAGISLLARSASAVRAEGQLYALFDVDNMSARIGAPPFVQALREMAAAAQTSGASQRRLTPDEVRAAFFAGQCGMAITWPSAASETEAKTPVAFAELPASVESYNFKTSQWTKKKSEADPRASLCGISGRLAAVTREARRSRSAFALLAWLGGDEASRVLGPASRHTTLFSRTQLANPAPWLGEGAAAQAASGYVQVAEAAFGRAVWMPVVRLPGVDDYHAALDQAVIQSLADPASAEGALTAVAARWDEITKQRGVAQQRRAYQRSLGNDF